MPIRACDTASALSMIPEYSTPSSTDIHISPDAHADLDAHTQQEAPNVEGEPTNLSKTAKPCIFELQICINANSPNSLNQQVINGDEAM